MAGFIPKRLYKGCYHKDDGGTTTCTDADTYYKVGGTWSDGNCLEGFTIDGSGKITYTGESGTVLLFNGVSDLSSDKVATITYALYKNGVLVTGAETPVSAEHANGIMNISITNFVPAQQYDYYEVYVKSDTANTIVTHNTLFLTFLGDR